MIKTIAKFNAPNRNHYKISGIDFYTVSDDRECTTNNLLTLFAVIITPDGMILEDKPDNVKRIARSAIENYIKV